MGATVRAAFAPRFGNNRGNRRLGSAEEAALGCSLPAVHMRCHMSSCAVLVRPGTVEAGYLRDEVRADRGKMPEETTRWIACRRTSVVAESTKEMTLAELN
jgi:hypothetical protein